MVKQGARWRICSRVNIPFLGAPWLKDSLSLSTTNPIFEPLMQVKLCDFIDQDLKMWKASLICSLFDAQTTQLILNTSLQPLVLEDKMIWKGERSGKYFVFIVIIIMKITSISLLSVLKLYKFGGMRIYGT